MATNPVNVADPSAPPDVAALTAGDPLSNYAFIDDINLDDLDLTNAVDCIDLSGVEANLNAFREDEIVRMALEQNINLGGYSKKIEVDLKNAEIVSIRDYIESSEDLVDLHSEIHRADGLLESMQSILSGFQDHLKQISGEITHLQQMSLSMNIELQNQKLAEVELNKYVEELEITADFIKEIESHKIDKGYIDVLSRLTRKMQFHSSMEHDWTAYQDVATKLLNLQNRATLRLRSFLIAQFNELGVPKTNISLHQQHLLSFKYFMTFLDERNEQLQNLRTASQQRQQMSSRSRLQRSESYSSSSSIMSGRLSGTFDDDIANQLRVSYTELMTKVYMGHFRSYVQSLTRHRETQVADKNDVLALDVEKTGGLFSSKKSGEYLNRVFNLGTRIAVLQQFNEPAIVVQMIDVNHRFQYEEIFKSFLRLLTDTAVNEYRFLLQFFHQKDVFNTIFDRVLQQFLEEFDAFRQSCYDSIGLLLMIRIVERMHAELEQKQVPCLEAFFDKIIMAFWPRFNIIFDDNVKSIKECEPTKSDCRLLNQRKSLNTPHCTTVRVASYITAILTLNVDNKQQILTQRIEQLRCAFQTLLVQRFADRIEDGMARFIWLINNYSIVIAIMNKEMNIATTKTYRVFSEALNKLSNQYIEEELKQHLSRWIGFTLTMEQKLSNDEKTKIDMSQLESVAREFKTNWKEKLKVAMNNIRENFALNVDATITQQIDEKELFRNQKVIKKKFLQQLLVYHARFEQVVSKIFANQGRNSQIQALIVPGNTMKYDVKALFGMFNE